MARGQEPPDVTCPEPELADGANAPWRPLLELDELDLDEPELPDVAAPDVEPLDLAELEPEATRSATAAACDPGRVYATPAAVSMLAKPAAAVMARSLPLFRSRYLIASPVVRLARVWLTVARLSGRGA